MKLAILASGTGSTAEVLFKYACVVITNDPEAGVIEKAKSAGIPVETMTRDGKTLEQFGEDLENILEKYNFDFISQNGWDLLTPLNICEKYEGRITNNHPAPLDPGYPDFGGKGMVGLAVHAAVINFSKKVNRAFDTEVCIHLVTPEFDKGELLAYVPVEILESDTPETLQARVKEVEKNMLVEFWGEVEKTGKLIPIQRSERLIKPEEFGALDEAKSEAVIPA